MDQSWREAMGLEALVLRGRYVIGPLLVLVAAGASGRVALAGRRQASPPRVVRIEETKHLAVRDLSANTVRRVFTTAADVLHNVTVSPDGEHVAVLEQTAGAGNLHGYTVLPTSTLVTLTMDGAVRGRVENVHRYVWCCASGQLAVITGVAREGGLGFESEGVAIVDVTSKLVTAVPHPEYPASLFWGPFDQSLYVKDVLGTVYRYEVARGVLDSTGLRDFFFSPDGRYYLHHPDPRDPEKRLYETAGNREVALPPRSLGGTYGWVFDSGAFLLLAESRTQFRRGPPAPLVIVERSVLEARAVYDVASGRVVQELRQEIADWVAPRGGLALRENDIIRLLPRPGF